MSARLPYGRPATPEKLSIAGGEAGLGDIAGAALEQMALVENTNAAQEALERAYEDWRRDIRAATGLEPPPNPVLPPTAEAAWQASAARTGALLRGETAATEGLAERVDRQRRDFQIWVNEQAARFPREAVRDWAERSPEQAAAALARGADEKLGTLMDSNPGWGKFAAAFAGGAVGALRDPLTIGSLALGGGPGAARTVAGRIVSTAAKEALINAGSELAAQPIVQDWRRRAGLPHGFDEAARNVLFAAALGGGLGAGGRGVAEALELARQAPLRATARRALEGDPEAAAELLGEIRDELPPDVRGALDALELERAREAERAAELAHVSARRHELLQSRAEVAAQLRAVPAPSADVDEVRVARLVESLAPRPDSIVDRTGAPADRAGAADYGRRIADLRRGGGAAPAEARPVAAWLKTLGGIHPEARIVAELDAAGVTPASFRGLFSPAGRLAMDNLPRAEVPAAIRQQLADDGNGYVSEQAIVDALTAESERAAAVPDALAAERAFYERHGIDFETMSDAAIAERMAAIDDAERRFLAAEPDNPLGLETTEAAFVPPGLTRAAHTEQVVRQILRQGGEGLSDDVVRTAADAHIVMGEDLADALDFALATHHGTPKTTPESAWADHPREPPEIEALPAGRAVDEASSAPRSGEDANRLGDPGDAIDWKALEEEGFGGDVLIPFGDDLMSLERLKQEIDEAEWLERVVEACKVA